MGSANTNGSRLCDRWAVEQSAQIHIYPVKITLCRLALIPFTSSSIEPFKHSTKLGFSSPLLDTEIRSVCPLCRNRLAKTHPNNTSVMPTLFDESTMPLCRTRTDGKSCELTHHTTQQRVCAVVCLKQMKNGEMNIS
ncbi:unnamed protein product [Protopolystoma xenopodis]|uniref:Uncharacterized protein n=1 Tax=Protopolystoma xenopodis TaxID=117903 RepID=A0A3S5BJS9_9PLAT|nr:unnamed protein product [Protopolystoma xenopodis]